MDSVKILAGLKQWKTTQNVVPNIFKNLVSLDLEYMANPHKTPTEIFEQWFGSQLDKLALKHPELAQMICLRFVEQQQVEIVAMHLNMSVATFYRKLPDATKELATCIAVEEEWARQVHQMQLYKRLDSPLYDRLFGREKDIQQLLGYLQGTTTSPIISVEGIGGLGKTTLLDAVAREAIAQGAFADIGWVSARTHQFATHHRIEEIAEPLTTASDLIENLARQLLGDDSVSIPFNMAETVVRLQKRFKTKPHLVVLDNLDTLENPEVLMEVLLQWSEPTKFLLSSRKRLLLHSFPYIIPNLSQADALSLVRYKTGQANMPLIAGANDDVLKPIYTHAGGNPLALLLIIGQLQHLGLSEVLESLRVARGRSIDDLYTYIYYQAWQTLPPVVREVWIATMFLPNTGGDFERLVTICGLESYQVQDALELLVRWYLVNHHRGTNVDESYYTIHSLTATFLIEEIRKWSLHAETEESAERQTQK